MIESGLSCLCCCAHFSPELCILCFVHCAPIFSPPVEREFKVECKTYLIGVAGREMRAVEIRKIKASLGVPHDTGGSCPPKCRLVLCRAQRGKEKCQGCCCRG